MSLRFFAGIGVLLALGSASPACADAPLFALEEGGRTFVYRARPGDHPARVAAMFGIPPSEVPAFLAANGITDPTRVAAGFVYRVPNAAARALGERLEALERDKTRLTQAVTEAGEERDRRAREGLEARAAAAVAESRAARLGRLERLWPQAQVGIVLLLLALGAASAVARAAVRRQRQAERWARALADELEEKRRTGLVERQESGRRVLDLESRVRELESRLGPRVVVRKG